MLQETKDMTKQFAVVAATLAALSLAGCGADGDAEPQHQTHTAPGGAEFNDADVEFATDMIQHHAQALQMVDLTMGRKLDPEVEQLAEEIRMAQAPEIEQMTRWLTDWQQPVPETVRDHTNAHGGNGGIDEDMPGMMSTDDMAELEAARGDEFQRMWLEMMIQHHEGAIEMSDAEREEGHFDETVDLATQISTAQQEEIDTMEELLGS